MTQGSPVTVKSWFKMQYKMVLNIRWSLKKRYIKQLICEIWSFKRGDSQEITQNVIKTGLGKEVFSSQNMSHHVQQKGHAGKLTSR